MINIEQHVETIYCDDIRNEVGNKLSLMGIYSSELFTRNFPLTLPTFCIVVKIVSFTHEKLPPMVVKILIDDEVFREETLIEVRNTKATENNEKSILLPAKSSYLIFKIVNLQLENECAIRVRVFVEGKDEPLKGLALNVLKAPSQTIE